MENKPDEVLTSDEDKQYRTFLLDGFRIKTGVEALDNFKDKIKGKTDTETKMKAWVQGKMRLRDPKKPAENGAFDKACNLLVAYIFKEQMQEAKKQRKLTDMPESIEKQVEEFKDRKNKEAVSLAFKIATSARKDTAYCSADKPMPIMTAARCQKCHGPHKIGARHKFEPAARGRGRPARRG